MTPTAFKSMKFATAASIFVVYAHLGSASTDPQYCYVKKSVIPALYLYIQYLSTLANGSVLSVQCRLEVSRR